MIVTSFIGLMLNLHEIKKKCYLNFSFSNILIDVLLGMFVFFILNIVNNFLPDSILLLKNLIVSCIRLLTFFLTHSVLKIE